MTLTTFEKLILNEEKKVSWTKLGLWIVSMAGITMTIPALPIWVFIVCKYVTGTGAVLCGTGIRDAWGKSNITPPSENNQG